MYLKPINEQVVVLFGATSGMGLQTALEMARLGARIALVGRDQMSVNQAVDRVNQEARAARVMEPAGGYNSNMMTNDAELVEQDSGQKVIGLVADATRWEEVKSVADQTMAHFGRIDTWVQTAGVSEWALFEDTSPEEFRQVIDVNLTGMAYGAMAALPYLKQQMSGAIIFISSVAGRIPIPYQAAYSASKHGVVALSNVMRMELKHEGVPVSVTTILPSSINTPLFNKSRTKLGVEPHPIPPIYAPELVARAIIHAAQHPTREISVGGAGWMLQVLRRISPGMATTYMSTVAFKQQRSDQVKTAIAPDNLFAHVEGYDHVDGDYGGKTMRFSPQLWFATHPKARMALNVALLSGLGFAAYRIIEKRRQPSAWGQVKKQVMRISQHLPNVHKKSRFDGLLEVLASLPLIGMLPFFNKPSLKQRVQHGVKMGVDRIPVEQTQKMLKRAQEQLPIEQTQKMLKRYQDRLPIEQAEKMVEKIQEHMPRRRQHTTVKEMTVHDVPDRVDVDVRVSQREARRAEKISRL